MSAYVIDFSDPLKNSFSIPDGSFNGPGGSSANTTLRLYGRGAREWGEAVDEDLVRLTENFASASAPSFPIAGQLWIQLSLYYRDTSLGNVLQGWYYYDVNSSATNKWTLLGGTGVVTNVQPLAPTEGQYYYDTTAGALKGYFSLGRYEPLTFVTRASISGNGAPVSPTVVPLQTLKVWDAGASVWSSPNITAVSAGVAPTGPQVGMFWFNTVTGNISVWSGSAWQNLLGPAIGGGSSVASGTLDMGGFKVINAASPTVGTDLATKAYVDGIVSGVGGFLSLSGGTLTGGLTGTTAHFTSNTVVDGSLTVNTNAAVTGTLQVTGIATFSTGLTVSAGGASISGSSLNMNSQKIINVATGTNSNDAVNVSQMNAAIAASGSGATTPVIYSSGIYKAGDICITGGKIYIAIGAGDVIAPGGNWRQVWPATYS